MRGERPADRGLDVVVPLAFAFFEMAVLLALALLALGVPL